MGRIRVKAYYSWPKKKVADINNCDSLIFDALANAIAWPYKGDDKMFLPDQSDFEDSTGTVEGHVTVIISKYTPGEFEDL